MAGLCQRVAAACKAGTGIPLARWLVVLLVCATGAARAACPGPAVNFETLAPGVWLVRAAPGDADASNRGFVANLLAVREGPRLWLLGSGPSPAFGRGLACRLRAVAGVPVSDVINPWPHPELVLGNAGFPGARRWAHADVAATMRMRCPRCEAALRERLAGAAVDLGPAPIVLPDRLLHGESGRLGPWRWWRLQRAADTPVTLWRLAAAPLWSAPGLLWADAAPDLREAELAAMQRSTAALQQLAAADGGRARWVPEQGPVQDAGSPARHAAYWDALAAAIGAALERGGLEVDVAATLPGMPDSITRDPRHALNWQRGWRELERRWMEGK